jgi:hypothetical protein
MIFVAIFSSSSGPHRTRAPNLLADEASSSNSQGLELVNYLGDRKTAVN